LVIKQERVVTVMMNFLAGSTKDW